MQFWLKRPLTAWQFLGALLIVVSIAIAKLPDVLGVESGTANKLPVSAMVLALVAATNSGKYHFHIVQVGSWYLLSRGNLKLAYYSATSVVCC